MKDINLSWKPEIIALQGDDELDDLFKLDPEFILVKWINYHLAKSGTGKSFESFEEDLSSGEIYAILLNQINSAVIDKSIISKEPKERIKKILHAIEK